MKKKQTSVPSPSKDPGEPPTLTPLQRERLDVAVMLLVNYLLTVQSSGTVQDPRPGK
jgi:hypothetical protein